MPSLFQIFWSFFKIGSFTLGGGYAMIPLIQREVVDRKKWLPEEEFVEMLGLAQASPGPIALNTAIFVGYKTRGISGIVSSSLGVVLPSFVIILLIAMVFVEFRNNPAVERVFMGIRPAVVALIAAPLWKMGKTAGITLKTIMIPVVVSLLVWLLHVSPVYIIIASIIGGIAYGVYQKNQIKKGGS